MHRPGDGGAMVVSESAKVSLISTIVIQHASAARVSRGGAIYVAQLSAPAAGSTTAALTVDKSVVYGGHAHRGGSLYVRGAAVVLQASVIMHALATEFGGGVCAEVGIGGVGGVARRRQSQFVCATWYGRATAPLQCTIPPLHCAVRCLTVVVYICPLGLRWLHPVRC